MHSLQQAFLPLVLATRKDCLKNESVNGAPQGDGLEWEHCSTGRWVSTGVALTCVVLTASTVLLL